ncbi:9f61ba91-3098-43f6-960a-53f8487549be [Sclerotinia trifoliorum]|uniref:9f61ba91-3098-43f6-960a-53f8487549be n=1 Tax=Sclerotinia trifoliorum TaxID=28548 RepID=A0A8H2ZQ59_9HELO|nr:9f61ba91-3098-43f6-960a-53f8487549be [Sclerotinia trifoliorum]
MCCAAECQLSEIAHVFVSKSSFPYFANIILYSINNMNLPICINGVHTRHEELWSLIHNLRNKRLQPIFPRPMRKRERLYVGLIRANWQIYLRHIRSLKSKDLKNIVSLKRFSQLPAEIQDLIWEFSLPGPRILYLPLDARNRFDIDGQYLPSSFDFAKYYNPPNPSALRTCRASRAVALKRYRIIPGPPSRLVYADFPGGDIIYLDGNNFKLFNGWEWRSSVSETSMNKDIVERVALCVDAINTHYLEIDKSLQKLTNIKQILVDYSKRSFNGDRWSHGPGIIRVEDLSEYDESNRRRREAEWTRRWVRTENDIAKGLRQSKLISTSITPNVSKVDWMVDLAEFDETIPLLKKFRVKLPISEPSRVTSETRAERYERRVNRKDSMVNA